MSHAPRVTFITVLTAALTAVITVFGLLEAPKAVAADRRSAGVHSATAVQRPTAIQLPGAFAVDTSRQRPNSLLPTRKWVRNHPRLHKAVKVAWRQRGDKYRWGAAGPYRFDCSGLVHYAYRKAGFTNVPRTSRQQYKWARHIKKRNIQRGDLMFFKSKGRVYHVAIFLGWRAGRAVMFHAPRPGRRVQQDPPWTTRWVAGTARR